MKTFVRSPKSLLKKGHLATAHRVISAQSSLRFFEDSVASRRFLCRFFIFVSFFLGVLCGFEFLQWSHQCSTKFFTTQPRSRGDSNISCSQRCFRGELICDSFQYSLNIILTRTNRKRFTAESQRAQSLRGFLRELSVSAVQKFLQLREKQAFNF